VARYTGPVVDVDVHHYWGSDDEVIAYMPERWHELAKARSAKKRLLPKHYTAGVSNNRARIAAAIGPAGSLGTDYETMCDVLLEPNNYHRAILTHQVGHYGGHSNPYFGIELVRAANDWTIEQWLPLDDRFDAVVLIRAGSPVEAAKEIRRVGSHPRMAAVCFAGNTLGRPYGDPIYDPIYEAAEEMGLHLALHFGAADRPGTGTTFVGGTPNSASLLYSQFRQQAMHYVTSYITNGTFEKFPKLKVMVKEYGVGWIPYIMWALDENYAALKRESPWVNRLPSEYIREHMKFSTQPLEVGTDPDALFELLSLVQAEDLICFSSDYPHWTTDDPAYIARMLPDDWKRKVMCNNACLFYGWDIPAESPSSRGRVAVTT
jgi:uncharacterized protein